MRGSIIGFDADTNTGAIMAQDGGRFDFVRLNWRGAGPPSRGTQVDFTPDGLNAIEIHPVVPSYDSSGGDTAQVIYILYLVGLLVGITGLVGVVMAYVNRSDAPDWVQTHYRFQIRTFWIGCLYAVISMLTAIILIGFLFAVFVYIWWIVRCVKGLKLQGQGAPYPNAGTWLW